MFEELTPAERRQILLASRIRFTPEVEVPRQIAIGKMVETALFVAGPEHWSSATEVVEAFEQLGGLRTLRVREIVDALTTLAENGRLEVRKTAPQFTYRLLPAASSQIDWAFIDSSTRLDYVLNELYRDVFCGKDPRALASFFLEFICDFFSHLGAQWADYLSGGRPLSPVSLEAVEKLLAKKTEKFKIDETLRSGVIRRSIHFLQHANPDFDYLKFSLGQSFYVVRLLGMDGKDYLSKEIFFGKTIYLDSSVVIPALLRSSRHHEVFQHLRQLCARLEIKLCVARPTVDEVRSAAASQESIAPTLYDQVPASLLSQVKGDFFRAYVALKSKNSKAQPQEVFEPFHDLAATIRTRLGAEVVDDKNFAAIPFGSDFESVKQVFQNASSDVRKRKKFHGALVHDATVFLYLRSESQIEPDKTWLVTRDVSLPKAWSVLQADSITMRAFLLDGLLQCISPFVVADEDIKDFSEVFSNVIASQLLPQSRSFDIDDFMLFQEIELDCSQLTDEEVQEGLLRVKKHVLHGAPYRHEDLGPAAYELRRFFTTRKDRFESLTKDRDRLEAAIAKLQQVVKDRERQHSTELSRLEENHVSTVQALEKRLGELEEGEKLRALRRKQRLRFVKKMSSLALLIVLMWGTCRAAVSFGEGANNSLRILSFAPYLALTLLVWLAVVKWVFFRKERLKEAFATWVEMKELLP